MGKIVNNKTDESKPKLCDIQAMYKLKKNSILYNTLVQGGSNMTETDLYVNKPHCAAAVRP